MGAVCISPCMFHFKKRCCVSRNGRLSMNWRQKTPHCVSYHVHRQTVCRWFGLIVEYPVRYLILFVNVVRWLRPSAEYLVYDFTGHSHVESADDLFHACTFIKSAWVSFRTCCVEALDVICTFWLSRTTFHRSEPCLFEFEARSQLLYSSSWQCLVILRITKFGCQATSQYPEFRARVV